MTGLARAEALSDGQGAFLEIATAEGPLELRFTYEDAGRLIAALELARERIQADRARSALPPLPDPPKAPVRWETALDPVNQDAVIRACYADRTSRETRIPRKDVGAIARFLEESDRRFEVSADMRQ
jgi:hypothetical protein